MHKNNKRELEFTYSRHACPMKGLISNFMYGTYRNNKGRLACNMSK